MSIVRAGMRDLGLAACCVWCDAPDEAGLDRCGACITHHRSVRKRMSDPALPAPVRDLIRDLMSMSSNPAAYLHDPIHGSMLAEQYRRSGHQEVERVPETLEDVRQRFEPRTKPNPLRDIGHHGTSPPDSPEDVERLNAVIGTAEAVASTRTVPARPIPSPDRSDRPGEDRDLVDRVEAAALVSNVEEDLARLIVSNELDLKRRDRERWSEVLADVDALLGEDQDNS